MVVLSSYADGRPRLIVGPFWPVGDILFLYFFNTIVDRSILFLAGYGVCDCASYCGDQYHGSWLVNVRDGRKLGGAVHND